MVSWWDILVVRWYECSTSRSALFEEEVERGISNRLGAGEGGGGKHALIHKTEGGQSTQTAR